MLQVRSAQYACRCSIFLDSRAHDTVGAVAVDCAGNVACATSTGGIRNKMVGRVGDSPVIGMTNNLRFV